MATPIDLSDLSMKQVRERVGELVEMSIRKGRVAILVARKDGVLTLLDPKVLSEVSEETMVECLVEAEWEEAHIEEFMNHLEKTWPKES